MSVGASLNSTSAVHQQSTNETRSSSALRQWLVLGDIPSAAVPPWKIHASISTQRYRHTHSRYCDT